MRLPHRSPGRLAALLAVLLAVAGLACAAEAAPPNVIVFYADDLGWGELGCQGNPEIPTPHIDSLAKSGVRCTQGYVAATYCSPSRAGLMTGRYPTRFGHEFNAVARHSGLPLTETTLPQRLKEIGYATVCIGKWHLGGETAYRPTSRGFDEFFGTLGNTPFYHPTQFIDTRKSPDVVRIDDDGFYTTDAYADRAVEWLAARAKAPDTPWFLYLPFNAQHAPLQAPQRYLDRFPGIPEGKRRTFAAMLSAMDDAVGRVLGKVREMNAEENTIVFFIADNGGPTQGTTSGNGILRGHKMETYEGGPRVPFLVQWKGKLPAGKTYDLPVMNIDVMPTVLAAAGRPVGPTDKNGGRIDGVDLVPHLSGAASGRPHETLFWRFGKQWAARQGDWKLVNSRGGSGRPELYDLAADPGEKNDLAGREPARVAHMQALYDAWNVEQAKPIAVDADGPKPKKAAAGKKGKQRGKPATPPAEVAS